MVYVAVTLKPGADVATVGAALARAGLRIEHRLEAIGSITGQTAPQAIPQLRVVAGVEDVCEILPVQIAPPDSPIQ